MNSLRSRKGAVMVWVIVLVVIAAGLGAVMMSITLDNPVMESTSSESVRAHYLAEAGARYALPIIKENFYNPERVVALLDGKGMQFDGVNSFTLGISYIFDPAKGIVYSLTSRGERGTTNATAPTDYELTDPEMAGFIIGNGNDKVTIQRDIVDTSTGSSGSTCSSGSSGSTGSSGIDDDDDVEVKVICLYEWPTYRDSGEGWYPVSLSAAESGDTGCSSGPGDDTGSTGSIGCDDDVDDDSGDCVVDPDAPASANSLDVKQIY